MRLKLKSKAAEVAVSTPEMDRLNEVDPKQSYVNFAGLTVVLRKKHFAKPEDQAGDRRFHATGGFGCNPTSMGNAVYGYYLSDSESARVERFDVQGVACNQANDVDHANNEKWNNEHPF